MISTPVPEASQKLPDPTRYRHVLLLLLLKDDLGLQRTVYRNAKIINIEQIYIPLETFCRNDYCGLHIPPVVTLRTLYSSMIIL